MSIGFEFANYSINEGNTVIINLLKYGNNNDPFFVEVGVNIIEGSSRDFNLTTRNITFDPADILKQIRVVIYSDNLVEDTESLNIVINPLYEVNIIDNMNSVTITILDQDSEFNSILFDFTIPRVQYYSLTSLYGSFLKFSCTTPFSIYL